MNYRGYEIRAEIRTLEQHSLDDEGQVIEAISNTAEIELEGYYAWGGSEDLDGTNFNSVAEVQGAIDLLLDPPMKHYLAHITCIDGEHEHVYRVVTTAQSEKLARELLKEHEYEWDDPALDSHTSFGDGLTAARVSGLDEISMEEYAVLAGHIGRV